MQMQHKISSLFLKLDVSKAFDAWTFLLEILSHLGFGASWCSLIPNLLKSATTQVLLNGEPGDPLSPMISSGVITILYSSSIHIMFWWLQVPQTKYYVFITIYFKT